MPDLRLPVQPILTEDLRRDLEALATLQQAGAHDDLVAQHGLVVVSVGGAVGAVVAVDGVSWVGFVSEVGLRWGIVSEEWGKGMEGLGAAVRMEVIGCRGRKGG